MHKQKILHYFYLEQDMNDLKLKKLEKDILICKNKLKELEPFIRENSAMATTYNQILVKKAILVNDYKNEYLGKNSLVEKIRHASFFKHKKKLICDYFQ